MLGLCGRLEAFRFLFMMYMSFDEHWVYDIVYI